MNMKSKENNGEGISFLSNKKKRLSVLFFNLLCLASFVLNAQPPTVLTGIWVFDHLEENEKPLFTRDAFVTTVFNSINDVNSKTYFLDIPLEINFMTEGIDPSLLDLTTSEGVFPGVEYVLYEEGVLAISIDEERQEADLLPVNDKVVLTTFSNVSLDADVLKMQYDYAYKNIGGVYVDGFLTMYFRRP
jgi:hypothetical protein